MVYFDIVDYDSVIGNENISLYIYKSGNICENNEQSSLIMKHSK